MENDGRWFAWLHVKPSRGLDSFGDRLGERKRGRPTVVRRRKVRERRRGEGLKREERGRTAKTVADWRPEARLQIPGVMPVIRGFGAQ